MTTTRTAADLTREEMEAALLAYARRSGSDYQAAAAHLLVFTELPGRVDFARHVDVAEVAGDDGGPELVARVKDWYALIEDRELQLTGGAERLLGLAAGWVAGRAVMLTYHMHGMGTAHTKRALEAMLIGSGAAGFYEIHDGPKLATLWRPDHVQTPTADTTADTADHPAEPLS
jgi:hypothetical protein